MDAFYWSTNTLNFFDDYELENYQKRSSERSLFDNIDEDYLWAKNNLDSLTEIYEANKNFGTQNVIAYNFEDFKEDFNKECPFKRNDFEFETFYDWENSIEDEKQSTDVDYFMESVLNEEKAGKDLYPVFERFISDLSLKPMLLKNLYSFCKVFKVFQNLILIF